MTANLFLPVDERLHGRHEGIVADNEQFAGLNHGRVFAQAFVEVDEMVAVQSFDFGIHFHHIGMAVKDVFARNAIAVHFNGHVVIHAQGFADGIVSKWVYDHVLAAEVAQDVRFVETDILGREEGVS